MVSEHASPLATLGGVDAGGQNVHVAALARELSRLGHAVVVYTRRDDAALPTRVRMPCGTIVEHVDAGPAHAIPKDEIYAHVAAFAGALRRAWRRERPDVVRAHFWMSGLASLEAAKALGIPVVQTFHALGSEKRRHQGSSDTSPPSRIRDEIRLAIEADRIVATSTAEMFELLRMGAQQDALTLVPCGVDLERFTPHGPRDERRRDRFRVVTLSRLVPRKGVDTVIKACANVPGVELVVAGGAESARSDDPETRRLRELCRALELSESVTFVGRVTRDDVPRLLRSADVVVCAPQYEPFGIVPLEAMACGVPTVVSSVGGLVDTVVAGVTGLHVPPNDPDRLSTALELLRSDPRKRHAMGRAGVERVRAHYSWQRVAVDTLRAYATVTRDVATDGELAIGI
jgi:D-inositol-3-phosphate glycosyltransferase